MAQQSNDELTPLGKILAIVGFFAGFSGVWQHSQELGPAFIAGVIIAAIGGFVGDLVWRILIVVIAVAISIGTFYVRSEIASVVIPEINEYSQPSTEYIPNTQVYSEAKKLYFYNDCGAPVSLAITFKNEASKWLTTGWWALPAYEWRHLADNNKKILLSSSDFYYFAESHHSNLVWEGNDYSIYFDGRTLGMRRANASINSQGDFEFAINCNVLDPLKDKYLLGFNGHDLKYFTYNNIQYDYGVRVGSVVPGMPAADAGLQSDDVIYQIDGKKVESMNFLLTFLNSRTNPWSPIEISYIRNNQLYSIAITPKKMH